MRYVPNTLLEFAAILLVAALTFSFLWARSSGFNPIRHLRWQAEQRAFRREQAAWIARLKADPLRAPYVARMEAGEPWTESRIEYDLDPERRESCAHLAGIEGDMRAAGVRIWFDGAGRLEADCVIDQAALAARYELSVGVGYREMHIPDRSLLDPPMALVACDEHGSAIQVVLEGREREGTKRFPA